MPRIPGWQSCGTRITKALVENAVELKFSRSANGAAEKSRSLRDTRSTTARTSPVPFFRLADADRDGGGRRGGNVIRNRKVRCSIVFDAYRHVLVKYQTPRAGESQQFGFSHGAAGSYLAGRRGSN